MWGIHATWRPLLSQTSLQVLPALEPAAVLRAAELVLRAAVQRLHQAAPLPLPRLRQERPRRRHHRRVMIIYGTICAAFTQPHIVEIATTGGRV